METGDRNVAIGYLAGVPAQNGVASARITIHQELPLSPQPETRLTTTSDAAAGGVYKLVVTVGLEAFPK